MKTVRILSVSLILTSLVCTPTSWANDWATQREPSALEKLNAGTQKLLADTTTGAKKLIVGTANGTKRFFIGVKDTLSWKKPAPRKTSASMVPWIRDPDPQYLRPPKSRKKSWLDSLLGREEPKQVETLKDWVNLPRPEF